MTRRQPLVCLALVFALGAASCATTPVVGVWRPWTRADGDVPAVGSVSVSVTAEEHALPGDPSPLLANLSARVARLLARRGFQVVDDDGAEYRVKVIVKTTRRDRLELSSGVSQSASSALLSSSRSAAGYGITVAQSLGAAIYGQETTASSSVRTQQGYEHSVGVEFRGSSGQVIWKGESTWESSSPEIRESFTAAMQAQFAALPSTGDILPEVPVVRPEQAENFFRIRCQGQSFACPALPSRITFGDYRVGPGAQSTQSAFSHWGGGVAPEDPAHVRALEAYLDLIETAEFALPTGKEFYGDPLDPDLWKRVQLGGEYRVGADRARVLVDLKGTPTGYEVESCRVATDQEWDGHVVRMEVWRGFLRQYFDYYEK